MIFCFLFEGLLPEDALLPSLRRADPPAPRPGGRPGPALRHVAAHGRQGGPPPGANPAAAGGAARLRAQARGEGGEGEYRRPLGVGKRLQGEM